MLTSTHALSPDAISQVLSESITPCTPAGAIPTSILTCFTEGEAILGEHPWLYEGTQSWTLKQLREEAEALAWKLKAEWQLLEGDTIALCFTNQQAWWMSFYALRLLNVTAVPLNLQIGVQGIFEVLKNAQVKGILAESTLLSMLLKQPSLHHGGKAFGDVIKASGGMPWPILLFASEEDAEAGQILQYLGTHSSVYDVSQQTRVTPIHPDNYASRWQAICTRTAPSQEEVAVILYTSGSTGVPKGVPLTEYNLLHNMAGFATLLSLENYLQAPVSNNTPQGITTPWMLLALPLFHSFGFMCGLYALHMKARVVLVPKFSPKAILQALQTYPISILPLVPTFFSLLLDAGKQHMAQAASLASPLESRNTPKPFPHLQYCISGGAALPVSLLDAVEHTLGVTVLEGYGLTETSPVLAVNTPKHGRVARSVGQVVPNVAIRLEPLSSNEAPWYFTPETHTEASPFEGEIVVQGPNVMSGYHQQPEASQGAFTQDGWFKTGDIGHFDAQGNLYISGGRIKDLIIKAGENIAPLKIEQALMAHPEVLEIAVIGHPDSKLGETIVAYCVPKMPTDATDATDALIKSLKAHAKTQLPPLYTPDSYHILSELPKTATGKIDKRTLKAKVQAPQTTM